MRIKFAALLLLIAVYGQSQDSLKRTSDTLRRHPRGYGWHGMPEKKIQHEIGVNATYFIKQVFAFSNTTLQAQPYQLTYKLIVKNKFAVRLGLGADMSSQSTTVSGSTIPRETNNSNLFGRIGVEYRKQLSRRFVGYAGIDFITSLINSKTTSVSDDPGSQFSQTVVTNNKNNAFGGGPVLGIQFYITKRMSFYTELPIALMMGSGSETLSTTTIQNNGFGQSTVNYQSTITNSTNNDLKITVPVTIYFAVKF